LQVKNDLANKNPPRMIKTFAHVGSHRKLPAAGSLQSLKFAYI
jgi:hypothetical protein